MLVSLHKPFNRLAPSGAGYLRSSQPSGRRGLQIRHWLKVLHQGDLDCKKVSVVQFYVVMSHLCWGCMSGSPWVALASDGPQGSRLNPSSNLSSSAGILLGFCQ